MKRHALTLFLVASTLACGCEGGIRGALKSLHKDPPVASVLKERQNNEVREYWIGMRVHRHVNTVTMWVEGDCIRRTVAFSDEVDRPSQQIYYIFVSPEGWRQHEWNVEIDEPNFVFRCLRGNEDSLDVTVEIVESRPYFDRDEQNRLIKPQEIHGSAANE